MRSDCIKHLPPDFFLIALHHKHFPCSSNCPYTVCWCAHGMHAYAYTQSVYE